MCRISSTVLFVIIRAYITSFHVVASFFGLSSLFSCFDSPPAQRRSAVSRLPRLYQLATFQQARQSIASSGGGSERMALGYITVELKEARFVMR
jgi:hypothetical protein